MARVENILARISGTRQHGRRAAGLALRLRAGGAGGGGRGSGVAAILEAARAIKTGPALRNDVILLLTDAEELGLLGARAFVEQHPWAKDVRMA